MGDRGYICIRNDEFCENSWIFLYTHWHGNDLIENTKNGLKRLYDDYGVLDEGMRQASYIFFEMVKERGAYDFEIECHEYESIEEIYEETLLYRLGHRLDIDTYILILEGSEISIFNYSSKVFTKTTIEKFIAGSYKPISFSSSKELKPILEKIKDDREKEQEKKQEYIRITLKREELSKLEDEFAHKAKSSIKAKESIRNILILGAGGTGKTSLGLMYTTGNFWYTELDQRIGFFLKKEKNFTLFLWELLRYESFDFLIDVFIQVIDGIIITYDLSRLISIELIERYISLCHNINPKIPILLVGTKSDMDSLVKEDSVRKIMQKFSLSEDKIISNKSPEQVNMVFEFLLNKVKNEIQQDYIQLEKRILFYEYFKNLSQDDLDKDDLLKFFDIDKSKKELLDELDINSIREFYPGFKEKILTYLKEHF